jgi:hypothetical protein
MEIHEEHTALNREGSRNSEKWVLGGKVLPRGEIVFFCQMVILFIVIVTSIINLSLGAQSELWLILLSTSLGAILPNPNLKVIPEKADLPRAAS